MAYVLDFTIPSAHAPFGGDQGNWEITTWGQDLESAAFKWVFYDPTDLSEVFSLTNAAAGSEGISATWYSDLVDDVTGAAIGATLIVPQIDEGTLEGLTFVGISDLVLGHTFYITPSGMLQTTHCYGTVTIKQGAPD